MTELTAAEQRVADALASHGLPGPTMEWIPPAGCPIP